MCVQGAIIGGLRHGSEPVPLQARGALRQISVASSSLKILCGVTGSSRVALLFFGFCSVIGPRGGISGFRFWNADFGERWYLFDACISVLSGLL